jgi:hypothetical protein
MTFRLSPPMRRTDPAFAKSSYELLSMFSLVFGIPLSFIALISGLVLSLSSKWGALRYPWVTTKLAVFKPGGARHSRYRGPATQAT